MNLSDTTTNTTKVKTMKLPTIYKRRLTAVVLVASVTLGLAACSTASAAGRSSASDTVNFGVSAAITGQYAQYGEQFKKAFDLAVEQVNAGGGINGHSVALKYEDSQSDQIGRAHV